MGSLTLNGSTSGQITLNPPAVAGTNTLTLPAATGTVLTTAGGQTVSGNTTVSGTVVMGSPFTMRNKIINGAMVIDQRNAGAAISASNNFTVDRFNATFSSGTITAQQSSVAPAGFSNSLSLTVTSSSAGTSSTRSILEQRIEGYNVADLGFGTSSTQAFTVSFWCRSSVAGTYSGSITDTSTRSYAFTFSIPSANTWTQISVTITPDTSGSNWSKTNGTGLALRICLGSGSTFLTTAGSWVAGNFDGATGTTNWINNASATFYITGVQLEIGTAATPFEYRNYQQELAMCQRYYWKSFPQTVAPATGVGASAPGAIAFTIPAANNAATPIRHPVTMRTSPSLTTYNTVSANSSWRDISNNVDRSVIGPYNMGDGGFGLGLTGGSGGANNEIHVTCNAEL